jgi:hypothetical protein
LQSIGPGEKIAVGARKGDEMYQITWKSGSLKAAKWAVGISSGNGFEAAVIRGKTYQEAQNRARLVIALLNIASQ